MCATSNSGNSDGAATTYEASSVSSVAAHATRLIDRFWMIGITAVLYSLLFREELLRLLNRWFSANESHGLLIPAFSLYFLYQDRGRLRSITSRGSYFGLLVILGSLAAYCYSLHIGMFYPRQVMMLTLLAGIVLLLGGWRILRVTWLPIVFLLFAMPLPARLYYYVTMPMRAWASFVAAVILNSFPNVQAEATGVVISGSHLLEAFNLNIAEACSGMRLLQAFLALGVAMAYLEYRPAFQRIVLLCSTIPIAIFCNMLRVLVTGIIFIYLGSEYSSGMLHTILGMVMLVVAFGMYGLLVWLMNRIFIADDEGEILVVSSAKEAVD